MKIQKQEVALYTQVKVLIEQSVVVEFTAIAGVGDSDSLA